ncbi:MAG: ABC transporter ATP-binding protein [bacterium]|nr:ABC transporter ATP-binding protein [bacterium]
MKDEILKVEDLSHYFRLDRHRIIPAVDRVSFSVNRGEIMGIVGESGSGKSTLARCIMNIYKATKGQIYYNGVNLCNRHQTSKNKKMIQTTRQMVFQDSMSSLNQRMKVADIITEPLKIHRIASKHGSLRDEAQFQLRYVGMDASYLDKYPAELSGGMRQRVAIARALSMEPELLIADEPIACLDVSIQAQIINLFKHLQQEHGFTFLFIGHDLSVVRYLCDRVAVMCQGKIVELAPTEELFESPEHPYTKSLLSAIPIPDPRLERARVLQCYDETQLERDGIFQEVSPKHYVLRNKEEAK